MTAKTNGRIAADRSQNCGLLLQNNIALLDVPGGHQVPAVIVIIRELTIKKVIFSDLRNDYFKFKSPSTACNAVYGSPSNGNPDAPDCSSL
jgi:hypothetical protein